MFLASTLSTSGQHRMSIGEMFKLIDKNNTSIQAEKTSVTAAQEGLKAAKNQRLPDINTQLSASYIGNAFMTDRDFTNAQNLSSPHFSNQFLLDVQQTIYAGGAINASIRMAELEAEQTKLGFKLSEQNQRFIALGQYLDLKKIANREKVLNSNIALLESQ